MASIDELLGMSIEEREVLLNDMPKLLEIFGDCFKLEPTIPDNFKPDELDDNGVSIKPVKLPKKTSANKAEIATMQKDLFSQMQAEAEKMREIIRLKKEAQQPNKT